MAYWATRGLRGSAFEELINFTNQLYLQRGLAVIQKVPTPVTPITVDNKTHTITSAYFEKKSTVDYIGVANGTALCFDVKETKCKNLPVKNIHRHQLEFMDAFKKQKGVSFLLVQFHFADAIFLLPIENLVKHWDQANKGGRKSIPYDAFDPALRVESKNGFPAHYLDTLQNYLRRSDTDCICS